MTATFFARHFWINCTPPRATAGAIRLPCYFYGPHPALKPTARHEPCLGSQRPGPARPRPGTSWNRKIMATSRVAVAVPLHRMKNKLHIFEWRKTIYGFHFDCFVMLIGSPNWQQLILCQLSAIWSNPESESVCLALNFDFLEPQSNLFAVCWACVLRNVWLCN